MQSQRPGGLPQYGNTGPLAGVLPSVSGQEEPWFQPGVDYSFDDVDDAGAAFAGDNDNDNDDADNRDPKRRRIARACDSCRKKKIKCDGKMPKCTHCETYKTECIFTQVEKKRAPPKGAKYIEGLENRLGRMESLLRLSGLLAEDDGGRTDLGTLEKRLAERQNRNSHASPQSQGSSVQAAADQRPPSSARGTPQMSRLATPHNDDSVAPSPATSTRPAAASQSTPRDPKEVDALADQMCSLITNNCGETRYIGSSSGFSIFSPKGIQWVNEKTGDNSFQYMIAAAIDDKHGDHWKPEVFNDIFGRRVFKQLPPRQECFALLKDFFVHFNQMFPLFHEPTFMHLVDRHYSMEPYEGSGWWASLNVALAIAHRLRVMSNVVDQEEDEHAWGYLKNAVAVVTELTMRNTDLFSVQALLGMALFLQGTPNPQPSFSLTASAIRLAHSIGLHKRGSGFNLNEVESEQRKRVFWIAYLLDKDICLRSGRPPIQDDDDMNVELPSEDPPDNVGNIPLNKEVDGKKTVNIFRLMCVFAQIQSSVYKRLYSVKASRQSDGELLNTIGELDAQLEEWKESIPLDFRPEHEISAAHTPLILHVVVMHFAFYNCLTTIHRMSVHHGYWTSRLSDFALQGLNARPLNPRVFMSAALCVNAARASIALIRYIPQGDYACVWLVLYYPVSALVTLFANILQNPQDARARGDLRLMSSVVSFLTMLERDISEANGNVRRLLSVCSEFERIAKVALDKASQDLRSGRGKRKAANGPTEREREKAMRDRRKEDVEIDDALSDGKTLEMMQVEKQAAYRRPVQTATLRASMDASSLAGSPASNAGANSSRESLLSPPHGHQRLPQTNLRNSTVAPTSQAQSEDLQPPLPTTEQHDNNMTSNNNFSAMGNPFDSTSSSQSLPLPANAHQPGLMDGFSPMTNSMMSSMGGMMDPLMVGYNDFGTPNGMNGTNGANAVGGAPFQQPFVPQDLWQMPMTLEWDWAEGLGLGQFAQGVASPMFDPYMGGGDGQGQPQQ